MKQTLRQLIAEGKTKQALDNLRQLNLADADLNAEVVQLSARFSQYERQQRMGVEDPSVLGIELRKINSALLSVIDGLPADDSKADLLLNYTKAAHAAANSSTHAVTADAKQPFSWTKWTGLTDVKSWIAVLAGLIAIYKFCGNEPTAVGTIKNVSISVENKERDLIPELTKAKDAYVIMAVDGGDVKKEVIDDKGKAAFQNVKVGDKVRLKIDFSEPFRPLNPDSVYTIPADGRLTLTAHLQHLNRVFGTVIYRDQPLVGVKVVVGDLSVMTDAAGGYKIQIPEQDQRKEQEVKFLKTGYKMLIKKAFPQTNEPLNIVMEK
jgi:Effector-associated domain 11